jgi:hypothetical protein
MPGDLSVLTSFCLPWSETRNTDFGWLQNLPDDDIQWSEHGAVALRLDADIDNQGNEKD